MTMKNLIRQALIAVVFLLTLSSMAQDREDKVLLTFEKKSEKLTEATGWAKNNLGKWISHKNVIDSHDEIQDTSRTSNFYWMQMGIVKYQGKKYYVLSYLDISGSYKYPAIEQDWFTIKMARSIIFPTAVYDSLKRAINLKSGKNAFVVTLYPNIEIPGEYDEPQLMAAIEARLLHKPSEIESMEFIVNSQTLKGESIVRFHLPMGASLSEFGRKLDEDIANESYFEVSATAFEKLLID